MGQVRGMLRVCSELQPCTGAIHVATDLRSCGVDPAHGTLLWRAQSAEVELPVNVGISQIELGQPAVDQRKVCDPRVGQIDVGQGAICWARGRRHIDEGAVRQDKGWAGRITARGVGAGQVELALDLRVGDGQPARQGNGGRFAVRPLNRQAEHHLAQGRCTQRAPRDGSGASIQVCQLAVCAAFQHPVLNFGELHLPCSLACLAHGERRRTRTPSFFPCELMRLS